MGHVVAPTQGHPAMTRRGDAQKSIRGHFKTELPWTKKGILSIIALMMDGSILCVGRTSTMVTLYRTTPTSL